MALLITLTVVLVFEIFVIIGDGSSLLVSTKPRTQGSVGRRSLPIAADHLIAGRPTSGFGPDAHGTPVAPN